MSEIIKAITDGQDRIIAIWEGENSGELYTIAKDSARAIENTGLLVGRIINDQRLNAETKQSDRKTCGLDALKGLAKAAARLDVLRNDQVVRANTLAAVGQYENGDAATPLVDLEICRKLSTLDDESARVILLITGEQPRLTQAAIRLPAFLSGLSDAEHRRITAAAIERANPEASRQIAQEVEDLNAATGAVSKAFKLIVDLTGASMTAQVAAAGEYAGDLVRNVHPDALKVMQSKAAGTWLTGVA